MKEELKAIFQRIDSASNHYEILGVGRGAQHHDIKKAYLHLSLLLHPDKGHCQSDQYFKIIVEAYRVLGNEEERAEYDATTPTKHHTRAHPSTPRATPPPTYTPPRASPGHRDSSYGYNHSPRYPPDSTHSRSGSSSYTRVMCPHCSRYCQFELRDYNQYVNKEKILQCTVCFKWLSASSCPNCGHVYHFRLDREGASVCCTQCFQSYTLRLRCFKYEEERQREEKEEERRRRRREEEVERKKEAERIREEILRRQREENERKKKLQEEMERKKKLQEETLRRQEEMAEEIRRKVWQQAQETKKRQQEEEKRVREEQEVLIREKKEMEVQLRAMRMKAEKEKRLREEKEFQIGEMKKKEEKLKNQVKEAKEQAKLEAQLRLKAQQEAEKIKKDMTNNSSKRNFGDIQNKQEKKMKQKVEDLTRLFATVTKKRDRERETQRDDGVADETNSANFLTAQTLKKLKLSESEQDPNEDEPFLEDQRRRRESDSGVADMEID